MFQGRSHTYVQSKAAGSGSQSILVYINTTWFTLTLNPTCVPFVIRHTDRHLLLPCTRELLMGRRPLLNLRLCCLMLKAIVSNQSPVSVDFLCEVLYSFFFLEFLESVGRRTAVY